MPYFVACRPSWLRRAVMIGVVLLPPLAAQDVIRPDEATLALPRQTEPIARRLLWTDPYQPLSNREKGQFFKRALLSKPALIRTAATTLLFQHLGDSPEEWGGDANGYGQRLASRLGGQTIRRTVQYGIGVMRHEDPRYFASGEKGVVRRLRFVAKQTVFVRTDDGGQTLAVGRIVGAYAGAYVSAMWLPESRNGMGLAFRRGSMVLVGNFVGHTVREFWPEIRQTVFRGWFRRLPIGAVDEATNRLPERTPVTVGSGVGLD